MVQVLQYQVIKYFMQVMYKNKPEDLKMFLGYQQGKIKFYTEEKLDLKLYNLDKIEEANDKYILDNDEYVLDDDIYKEKQKEKEKERINSLTMTKRVLALQLQELGIPYAKLKELIASNEQAQLEWDLCERLERNNPLLDLMGAQLNITSEQIDNMFRVANGEKPLKTEQVTEQVSEQVEDEEDD